MRSSIFLFAEIKTKCFHIKNM